MLQSISIENFAIIDRLDVDFGAGLNVITGETGAGKTIIAQALNLILGDRASADLIRSGENRAKVTASFSLKNSDERLRRKLDDMAINAEEELIIHRSISADGKGKATINGMPATQQTLKEIAEQLVDISSQHEHQLLLNPKNHIDILDQFGKLQVLRERYAETHKRYQIIEEQLMQMRQRGQETKERLDFIRYQMQELKVAKIRIGEDQELEVERMRIKNAVQLELKMREAEKLLYESSGSAVELTNHICETLAFCSQMDPGIVPWRDGMVRITSELSDLSRDIKRYADKLNSDPLRLEEIEDRIHLLKNLKKKYGGTLEGCVEKLSSLEKEIEQVDNWDDLMSEKEELLSKARAERSTAAANLSDARKTVACELEKFVEKETSGLGFKKIQFKVDISILPEEEWNVEGKERIEFTIAPNVGEKLRPLAKIVSGGELSRIMLAIKRVLTDRAGFTLTSIFDEVDSGIGGATAEIVGRKLKEVAKNRQVICITHLPQIASFGDHHFAVVKNVKKGRTTASIESLKGEARTNEMARMLGGTNITEATKTHAVEMLNLAKS